MTTTTIETHALREHLSDASDDDALAAIAQFAREKARRSAHPRALRCYELAALAESIRAEDRQVRLAR